MKKPIRYGILLTILLAACVWIPNAHEQWSPDHYERLLCLRRHLHGPKSQGIYVYKLSAATGKLTPLGLAGKTTSPSFLAVSPNHRYLYAVNEISDYEGKKSGSVSAFSIDRKTGKLTFLNVVPSGDPGPCHVTVDHTGKYVFVANYEVGSVAAFPILADGRLGKATAFLPHTGHSVDPKRQEASHAHSIYPSPDNRFVVSADLGTDKVYVYRFDADQGNAHAKRSAFRRRSSWHGPAPLRV